MTTEGGPTHSAGPAPSVALVTRGRSGAVGAQLESLPAGWDGSVLLVDEGSRAHGSELANVAADARVRVSLSFREDRIAWIDRVARELRRLGGDPDLLRFALLGEPGRGGVPRTNRNTAMVAGAGRSLAVLDDDLRWEGADPPALQPGVRVLDGGDPTLALLAADPGELAARHPTRPVDLAGLLCQGLGQPVSWGATTQPPLPGRVRVRSAGILGDSGMRSPHYFLTRPSPFLEALAEDPLRYRELRTTRLLLRSAPCLTLSPGGFLMHAAVGYDLTRPLPPVLPHLPRNQDGVFSRLLRGADPTGWIEHLPLAVRHAHPEVRSYQPDDPWRLASAWGLAELVLHLLPQGAVTLAEAGGALMEWGRIRPHRLGDHLIEARGVQLAMHIDLLEGCLDLDGDGRFPWWEDDLARAVGELERALGDPEGFVPGDLEGAGIAPFRDSDELAWVRAVQPLLLQWGALLQGWIPTFEALLALPDPLRFGCEGGAQGTH